MIRVASQALPAAAGTAAFTGLRNYYFVRAVVSAVWVAAAFVVGAAAPLAAAVLLVAYPAWDGIANLIDAARSGGLARNGSQAINAAVSGITAIAVAAMLANMNAVLGIFGAWAILAGLLQLLTAVRRWRRAGAQWVMVLSGAQSALAGGLFIQRALGSATPSIVDIAPYAGVGAFYFAVSALWLTFRRSA
jgi:uncharacterized membrane protein HdeD (DUF308 family)